MPFTVSDDGIGCLIVSGGPTTPGTLEVVKPSPGRSPNGNRILVHALTIVTAGVVTEFLIGFGLPAVVRFRSGALLNGIPLEVQRIKIEGSLDQSLMATLLAAGTVTANLFYTLPD